MAQLNCAVRVPPHVGSERYSSVAHDCATNSAALQSVPSTPTADADAPAAAAPAPARGGGAADASAAAAAMPPVA